MVNKYSIGRAASRSLAASVLLSLAACGGSSDNDNPTPGNPGGPSPGEVGAGAPGSGTVYGLSGTGLVLEYNGETLTVDENGAFEFENAGGEAGGTVSIAQQPTGATEQCTVLPDSATAEAGARVTCVSTVAALYPNNGANWNDYVLADGDSTVSASDSACEASDSDCLHGGEMRALTLPGVESCEGIAAADARGHFQWSCDATGDQVRVVSGGLNPDTRLSDLIDSTPAWEANALTVTLNGEPLATTPESAWWDNPIVAANTGNALADPGTVYLVNSDPAGSYSLAADGIALVIAPEVRATGTQVSAQGVRHLWLEGDLLATGQTPGLGWTNVDHSVLNHVSVSHADGDAPTDARCVSLVDSDHNRLHAVRAAGCDGIGLYLENSNGNRLTRTVASSNREDGIQLRNSSDNQLIDTLSAANLGDGIEVNGGQSNFVAGTTVANNTASGLMFLSTNNNTLSTFSGTNNVTSLYLGNAGYSNIIDVVSAHNERHAVAVNHGFNAGHSVDNYFTGELRVGRDPTATQPPGDEVCQNESPDGGLINSLCSETGADGSNSYGTFRSDAVLRTSVSQAASYVGEVSSDDAENGSDAAGATDYDPSIDWSHFENRYRAWGRDGDTGVAFPDASQRGSLPMCSAGNESYQTQANCEENAGGLEPAPVWLTDGRIWDFRLAAGDTGYQDGPAALGVLGQPSGNDTAVHTWADGSTTTFLRRAWEIANDGRGNDNGLCESGETCLYTPNLGAYQGHGALVPAGSFADGTITNVTLLRHSENGI